MKNIFKILIGLFLVLFAISCSNDEATEILAQNTQEVVFDINNFIPQDVSGKGLSSAKDNGDSLNDPLLPNCAEGDPSYVEVTFIGPNQPETTYTLDLVTLNNKTETEVMKLAPGTYTITEFVVFTAGGEVLWAAPKEGSYYEVLWDLTGVNLEFVVPKFYKLKVEIDVLCYKPYQYELFGYAWFKYAPIEIHTICFYGDICTKFYDEWHRYYGERNPYMIQKYDGYDFPAIFYVNIKNEEGFIVNDNRNIQGVFANSNLSWLGIGSPLCIEYPDQVDVDETFTFEIMLKLPTGEWKLIYVSEPFADTAMSEAGNEDSFGGIDGVFDFVIGNCSYDDNDASLELLPWIPVPDTADMSVYAPGEPLSKELIIATFSNINPVPVIPGIIDEGVPYNTLCGEEFVDINLNFDYRVNFYSSLDRNLPAPYNFPTAYKDYPWGSINWLANKCETVAAVEGWDYVEYALWYLIWAEIDGVSTTQGINNDLAKEAALHPNFIPAVGDYACVLVKPYEQINVVNKQASAKTNAILDFQLLLLRVDP